MAGKEKDNDSLLETLRKRTEQIAGGTFDFARNTATLTAMFGESWLRNTLLNKLEPERLEAMAEAGRFLQDARETAGMSLKDLSESLGLSDRAMLEDIESGETIMPLELMLRSAALLARHDPIPFLIKFMRTYNPALEKTLEQWGVLALPKQYERERRFVNLMRQHDVLRRLSDDEYDRYIHYMESSSNLVLDVMNKEKAANAPAGKAKATHKPKAKPKSKSRAPRKKKVAGRAGKQTPAPRSDKR
tara:strand:+ start:2442 stop:3179 length:738 start_codon:yes stop_codon:yes gene_type:complete